MIGQACAHLRERFANASATFRIVIETGDAFFSEVTCFDLGAAFRFRTNAAGILDQDPIALRPRISRFMNCGSIGRESDSVVNRTRNCVISAG